MTEYEMYKEGMSIPDVSKKTGIPLSTLRFRFKRAGILRSRSEAVKLAAKQGKLGSGLRVNPGFSRRSGKITYLNQRRERERGAQKNLMGI